VVSRFVQEFLWSNIKQIVPEPIGSFHDELLQRFATTGTGTVINEQRVVFGKMHSGHVFPIALFVRGHTDGISVVGVIQAIVARDNIVLCSGASHLITGLSESSAHEFDASGEMKGMLRVFHRIFPVTCRQCCGVTFHGARILVCAENKCARVVYFKKQNMFAYSRAEYNVYGVRRRFAGNNGILLESILPNYESAFGAVSAGEYVTIAASSGRSISASRVSAPFPNGAIMHIIAWHEVEADSHGHDIVARHSHSDFIMPEAGVGRRMLHRASIVSGADAEQPAHSLLPGGRRVMSDVDDANADHNARGDGTRSERSGKTTASVTTVFRRALLDGREGSPPPLRRLREMGLVVAIVVAIAAISLASVASNNLNAVVASTLLVASGASRCAAQRRIDFHINYHVLGCVCWL
jgi:hypothetical protein